MMELDWTHIDVALYRFLNYRSWNNYVPLRSCIPTNFGQNIIISCSLVRRGLRILGGSFDTSVEV